MHKSMGRENKLQEANHKWMFHDVNHHLQVTFTNPKRLLSGLERTAPLVEHVEVLLIKEVTWWWWRILAERIHNLNMVADVKLHLNK